MQPSDKQEVAAVFWGNSHNQGITYHFANMCGEFRRGCERLGLDFYFLSEQREREPGLLLQASRSVTEERLLSYPVDRTDEAVEQVRLLLKLYRRVVLHVQGYRQLLAMRRLKTDFRDTLRIVYTVHSYRNTQPVRRFFQSALISFQLLRWVDRTVFLTPAAQHAFVGSSLLRKRGLVSVIPLGVEEYEFIEPTESDVGGSAVLTALQRKDLVKGIYLASFYRAKGQEWLVRELESVMRQEPGLVFFLFGKGRDLELVRKQVAELGLADRIHCPGRIERKFVPWVVRQCDFTVVPSRSETFGHNSIEPMTMGLPAIATPTGAAEYMVQDYLTGLRVPFEATGTIAESIRLLMKNPQLMEEMGARAQACTRLLFSHAATARAHAVMYASLVR